jgi:hypothetical protein
LPRSCCFRPRSIMPLLHSWPFKHIILDVRPFGVLGATLSWSCPLRRATSARCIISLGATANSFRDSRLAWIRIFLVKFLFRHATFGWRDTFLQAAADFILDPVIPGSFPSASDGAPRPDSGPYAASLVLRTASLRPLPWGSPDAPVWTE